MLNLLRSVLPLATPRLANTLDDAIRSAASTLEQDAEATEFYTQADLCPDRPARRPFFKVASLREVRH